MYLFHRESGGKILQASQRLAPHTHAGNGQQVVKGSCGFSYTEPSTS